MRKIKEGIIDLEELFINNIAIQCDTEEDEEILINHLDSLGVTTRKGDELCSFTYTFGLDCVSYWNLYAEDGFYLIRKTRLDRYYLCYCSSHNGITLNISNHIDEVKEAEIIEEKKDSKENIIFRFIKSIFA